MPPLKCNVSYVVSGLQVQCAFVTVSQDMTGHLGVVPAAASAPVGDGLLFRARAERPDGEPSDYWLDCRLVRIPPESLVEIRLFDEIPGVRPVLPFSEDQAWPFAGDVTSFAGEATLQDGDEGEGEDGEDEDEDLDPYASPAEEDPGPGAYVARSDLLLGPGSGLAVVASPGPSSGVSASGSVGAGRPPAPSALRRRPA